MPRPTPPTSQPTQSDRPRAASTSITKPVAKICAKAEAMPLVKRRPCHASSDCVRPISAVVNTDTTIAPISTRRRVMALRNKAAASAPMK